MDKNLKKIFSALVIYYYNMRMLHWKTKGLDFDGKHELVDEYRKVLADYVDDIAELMLMQHENPPSLAEVINFAHDDDEKYFLIVGNDEYYSDKKIFGYVSNMFEHLIMLYETSCKDKENNTGDIISKLREHQYYFRKEFEYKCRNRMM